MADNSELHGLQRAMLRYLLDGDPGIGSLVA